MTQRAGAVDFITKLKLICQRIQNKTYHKFVEFMIHFFLRNETSESIPRNSLDFIDECIDTSLFKMSRFNLALLASS